MTGSQAIADDRLRDFFAAHQELPSGASRLLDGMIAKSMRFDDSSWPSTGQGIAYVPPASPVVTPASAAHGCTHQGHVRPKNEDTVRWEQIRDGIHLLAVADGVGGSTWGEVASSLAVHTLFQTFNASFAASRRGTRIPLRRLLEEAVQEANVAVTRLRECTGESMSTTLCAAVTQGNREAWIANVGDSRAYLVRGHKLRQLTQDHSLVAMMRKRNLLTEQEADDHPWKKVLTRVIGKHEDVKTDLFRISLRAGDRLLLCSDGLWGEADPLALAETLYRHLDPRVACKALVEDALQAGGRDNIGCVLWNAGLAKNPTGSGGLTRRLRFWRN